MVHPQRGKAFNLHTLLSSPHSFKALIIKRFFFFSYLFRDTILKLLLDGARELGNIVCSHIRALLNELHTLRRRPENAAAGSSTQVVQAGTSSEDGDNEGVDRSKGFLMVRF